MELEPALEEAAAEVAELGRRYPERHPVPCRENEIGGSGGAHLNPLGLLFLRTSVPFIWRILSAFRHPLEPRPWLRGPVSPRCPVRTGAPWSSPRGLRSHRLAPGPGTAGRGRHCATLHYNENCTGLAQIARLGPTLWLKVPIYRALKLHGPQFGPSTPGTNFATAAAIF
jgi:hypothetical protein